MLLQKHQEHWAKDFNELKKVLEDNITISDIRIEHIGSTSVKGLAAKPIIDIDIVYKNETSFEIIKTDLELLGYYHNGDQGIAGREVFKRTNEGEQHIILDHVKHHLYVCHNNSTELHRHLAFRDYLRKHEQARITYEKLKYEIAEKTNQDRKAYADLKEVVAREFIESIIKKSTQQ